MLRSMTIHQFMEWRFFDELEPFGEERADFRAASIVQTLLNQGRGKGRPAYKLDDCRVLFGDAARPGAPTSVEQARAEILATMELLMAIYN